MIETTALSSQLAVKVTGVEDGDDASSRRTPHRTTIAGDEAFA